MIYLEGLESIAESIYLDENLDNRAGNCNIFVNPDNIGYIVGKTIIINKLGYSEDKVRTLLKNNCRVISRIHLDVPGINFCPYILRLCSNIIWNGHDLDYYSGELSKLLEEDLCSFSLDDYILYFPRIYTSLGVTDIDGNLTSLGWILQQVGVNIKKDTPFINLDLIKTRKIAL
jgi:hypothetical protein